jgi:hypothetical protein
MTCFYRSREHSMIARASICPDLSQLGNNSAEFHGVGARNRDWQNFAD